MGKKALESTFPQLPTFWKSVKPLRAIMTQLQPKIDKLTRFAADRKKPVMPFQVYMVVIFNLLTPVV